MFKTGFHVHYDPPYLEVVIFLVYQTGFHVCVAELFGLPAGIPLKPEETLQNSNKPIHLVSQLLYCIHNIYHD